MPLTPSRAHASSCLRFAPSRVPSRAPSRRRVVARCPTLILQKPSTTHAKLSAWAQTLGLPAREAAALLVKWPPLLMASQDGVKRKLSALSAALRLSRAQATRLVYHMPMLLCLSSATLEAKLAAKRARAEPAAAAPEGGSA